MEAKAVRESETKLFGWQESYRSKNTLDQWAINHPMQSHEATGYNSDDSGVLNEGMKLLKHHSSLDNLKQYLPGKDGDKKEEEE